MGLIKRLLLIFLTLSFLSCNSKGGHPTQGGGSATPVAGTESGMGGTTDIGSGGSGSEAQWKAIATELSENIRRLVYSEIDKQTFDTIKSKLPTSIETAKVRFKDYPLMLGIEVADQDNPSNAKFQNQIDCTRVNSERNLSQEKDAINFQSNGLIKVSRPRFECYNKLAVEVRRLILHEHLGLIGITETDGNGTHYQITNQLLKEFKAIEKFDNGLDVQWIKTCEDLQKVGSVTPEQKMSWQTKSDSPQRFWRLANDINCSQSLKFVPISLFGMFDGNGFTVKGLKTTLFNSICLRCTVANLRIEGTETGDRAILAEENNGTIFNCFVEGKIDSREIPNVKPEGPTVFMRGGLVARNKGGVIGYTESRVSISTPEMETFAPVNADGVLQVYTGGLVGFNEGGAIHHSRSVAKIISHGSIGGLVGQNQAGSIRTSKSKIEIEAGSIKFVGGLAGTNLGLIEDSFAQGSIRLLGATTLARLKVGDIGVGGLVGYSFYGSESLPMFSESVVRSKSQVSLCGSLNVKQRTGSETWTYTPNLFIGILVNGDYLEDVSIPRVDPSTTSDTVTLECR